MSDGRDADANGQPSNSKGSNRNSSGGICGIITVLLLGGLGAAGYGMFEGVKALVDLLL